jgi:iron(III) transport system ATP-binding protein
MRDAGARGELQDAALSAVGIGKVFAGKAVLEGIELDLPQGEVLALLGPSGCGKTTFLRIVAGLMAPDQGTLSLLGRVVARGGGTALPPEARGLGMVFQDYALWPHLSVVDNVAFPLRMRGLSRTARRERALAALRRVALDHLADRAPGTLSGGQQQRVALARAVVAEPPIVLFDEPLSNLDRELRESLALDIARLMREFGLTGVYVTHDQNEAFTVADRVAVMQAGRIAQVATPETLFRDPASLDVARFLNIGAILRGRVENRHFVCPELGEPVRLAAGAFATGAGSLLIPRSAVGIVPPETTPLRARVAECRFQGDRYMLQRDLGGAAARVPCSSDRPAPPGETVGLALAVERLRFFPDDPRTERGET